MNCKKLLVAVACIVMGMALQAQTGVVTIHQNATLDSLLYQEKNKETITLAEKTISATGYRVQIYSSNASRKAKEQAFQWKATLEEAYPEHRTYVQYQAPFWKVRIGDFTHYAEAVVWSNALKKVYPNAANEIMVVKEKQVKPIYLPEEAVTDSIATSETDLLQLY